MLSFTAGTSDGEMPSGGEGKSSKKKKKRQDFVKVASICCAWFCLEVPDRMEPSFVQGASVASGGWELHFEDGDASAHLCCRCCFELT